MEDQKIHSVPTRGTIVVDANMLKELATALPEKLPLVPGSPIAALTDRTNSYLDVLPILAQQGYRIVIPETIMLESANMLTRDKDIHALFPDEPLRYDTEETVRNFFRHVVAGHYPQVEIAEANTQGTQNFQRYIGGMVQAFNQTDPSLSDDVNRENIKRAIQSVRDKQKKSKRDMGEYQCFDVIDAEIARSREAGDHTPIFFLSADKGAREALRERIAENSKENDPPVNLITSGGIYLGLEADAAALENIHTNAFTQMGFRGTVAEHWQHIFDIHSKTDTRIPNTAAQKNGYEDSPLVRHGKGKSPFQESARGIAFNTQHKELIELLSEYTYGHAEQCQPIYIQLLQPFLRQENRQVMPADVEAEVCGNATHIIKKHTSAPQDQGAIKQQGDLSIDLSDPTHVNHDAVIIAACMRSEKLTKLIHEQQSKKFQARLPAMVKQYLHEHAPENTDHALTPYVEAEILQTAMRLLGRYLPETPSGEKVLAEKAKQVDLTINPADATRSEHDGIIINACVESPLLHKAMTTIHPDRYNALLMELVKPYLKPEEEGGRRFPPEVEGEIRRNVERLTRGTKAKVRYESAKENEPGPSRRIELTINPEDPGRAEHDALILAACKESNLLRKMFKTQHGSRYDALFLELVQPYLIPGRELKWRADVEDQVRKNVVQQVESKRKHAHVTGVAQEAVPEPDAVAQPVNDDPTAKSLHDELLLKACDKSKLLHKMMKRGESHDATTTDTTPEETTEPPDWVEDEAVEEIRRRARRKKAEAPAPPAEAPKPPPPISHEPDLNRLTFMEALQYVHSLPEKEKLLYTGDSNALEEIKYNSAIYFVKRAGKSEPHLFVSRKSRPASMPIVDFQDTLRDMFQVSLGFKDEGALVFQVGNLRNSIASDNYSDAQKAAAYKAIRLLVPDYKGTGNPLEDPAFVESLQAKYSDQQEPFSAFLDAAKTNLDNGNHPLKREKSHDMQRKAIALAIGETGATSELYKIRIPDFSYRHDAVTSDPEITDGHGVTTETVSAEEAANIISRDYGIPVINTVDKPVMEREVVVKSRVKPQPVPAAKPPPDPHTPDISKLPLLEAHAHIQTLPPDERLEYTQDSTRLSEFKKGAIFYCAKPKVPPPKAKSAKGATAKVDPPIVGPEEKPQPYLFLRQDITNKLGGNEDNLLETARDIFQATLGITNVQLASITIEKSATNIPNPVYKIKIPATNYRADTTTPHGEKLSASETADLLAEALGVPIGNTEATPVFNDRVTWQGKPKPPAPVIVEPVKVDHSPDIRRLSFVDALAHTKSLSPDERLEYTKDSERLAEVKKGSIYFLRESGKAEPYLYFPQSIKHRFRLEDTVPFPKQLDKLTASIASDTYDATQRVIAYDAIRKLVPDYKKTGSPLEDTQFRSMLETRYKDKADPFAAFLADTKGKIDDNNNPLKKGKDDDYDIPKNDPVIFRKQLDKFKASIASKTYDAAGRNTAYAALRSLVPGYKKTSNPLEDSKFISAIQTQYKDKADPFAAFLADARIMLDDDNHPLTKGKDEDYDIPKNDPVLFLRQLEKFQETMASDSYDTIGRGNAFAAIRSLVPEYKKDGNPLEDGYFLSELGTKYTGRPHPFPALLADLKSKINDDNHPLKKETCIADDVTETVRDVLQATLGCKDEQLESIHVEKGRIGNARTMYKVKIPEFSYHYDEPIPGLKTDDGKPVYDQTLSPLEVSAILSRELGIPISNEQKEPVQEDQVRLDRRKNVGLAGLGSLGL